MLKVLLVAGGVSTTSSSTQSLSDTQLLVENNPGNWSLLWEHGGHMSKAFQGMKGFTYNNAVYMTGSIKELQKKV